MPPLIPDHVDTCDNTKFSWHDRCPRLFQLSGRRHLRRKGANKSALAFGSLLHTGLEAFYTTGSEEETLKIMREDEDFQEPLGDDHRTRGRALITISEYIEYWGNNSIWWGDDVLFTETPFTLEDKQGFRYGGVIDLIVLYRGEPWIVDHKSTSRGGDTWWDQFKNSPQMAGYTWAGTLLHGRPVRGVIINRLLVHKNKKPPHEQFARQAMLFPPHKVEEWRRAKIEQYHEIARQQEAGYFPPRWNSCVDKYGKCSFFSVCTLQKENRERILNTEYEEEEWTWVR